VTTPETEAAVRAANERFYAAFAARDIAAMESAWAESVPIACTHPGWMTLHGRLEVLDSWRAIMANPAQARVVPGDARVTLLGDVAIVHCREFVAGSAIVATNVFLREDDEWRLVDHHGGPVAM
jgi:ketosteroid isomerase-like protein